MLVLLLPFAAQAQHLTFSDPVLLVAPAEYFFDGLLVADLNQDGLQDILYKIGSLEAIWHAQQDSMQFSAALSIPGTAEFSATIDAESADVDLDGVPDLIMARSPLDSLSYSVLKYSEQAGTLGITDSLGPQGGPASRFSMVDLDGDLDPDLLKWSTLPSRPLGWYENTGPAGLSAYHLIDSLEVFTVLSGDVDNDGDLDICLDVGNAGLYWLENMDGSASQFTLHAITESGRLQGIADVDSDGDPDLLAWDYWNNFPFPDSLALHLYRNTAGTGVFTEAQTLYAGIARSDIYRSQFVDLDEDGDVDILVAATAVYWYENLDGQGNYSELQTLKEPFWPDYASILYNVVDLDTDGLPDLVVHDWRFGVAWMRNMGMTGIAGNPLPATPELHPRIQLVSPNPFNAQLRIDLQVPHAQSIQLALYNVAGQRVLSWPLHYYPPGAHTVRIDEFQGSSGKYFLHLQAESSFDTRGITLIK